MQEDLRENSSLLPFLFDCQLFSAPDPRRVGGLKETFGASSNSVSTVVVPGLGRCQAGPHPPQDPSAFQSSTDGGRERLRDIRPLRDPQRQVVQLVTKASEVKMTVQSQPGPRPTDAQVALLHKLLRLAALSCCPLRAEDMLRCKSGGHLRGSFSAWVRGTGNRGSLTQPGL